MKEALQKHKQYLLTGVSYVVPFIACGGILIALSIAFAPMTATGPDFSNSPNLKTDCWTSGPLPSRWRCRCWRATSPSAWRGGQGWCRAWWAAISAGTVNAGFLGALVAGLAAGHLVNLLKKSPTHRLVKPLMPIIIIPIVSALAIGLLMLKVVGVPIADFMTFLAGWLESMGKGNAVLLAAILGAMIAFDMGGPVNKAAFFFGAAMISKGNYAVMGACAAAICTPPLGLGLATLIGRKLWTEEQRESGPGRTGHGHDRHHRRARSRLPPRIRCG